MTPRVPHRRNRVLLALGVALIFLSACGGGDDSSLATPETTAAPSDAPAETTAVSVEVPTAEEGETETTPTSGDTTGSADEDPASTDASDTTESTDAETGEDTDTTDDDSVDTTAVFTSSPPPSDEKVGCPEGLILVGSGGTEPICSQPGAGCPEGYRLIGGDNGAALCQDDDGSVLRVSPDGTISPDTAVPFNGPVCRRVDADGNLVGIGLATSQEECEASGGEYLPDGI